VPGGVNVIRSFAAAKSEVIILVSRGD
jgi:hypothetical protein